MPDYPGLEAARRSGCQRRSGADTPGRSGHPEMLSAGSRESAWGVVEYGWRLVDERDHAIAIHHARAGAAHPLVVASPGGLHERTSS